MRAQPAAGFLVTLEAMDAGISTERPVSVLSQVLLVEAEITKASGARRLLSKATLQGPSG